MLADRRVRAAALVLTAALWVAPLPPAAAQQALPPHAWLFGAWTGGLFPAPSGLTAQMCLQQPVMIFTRDVVLRATITDVLYTQREIETVRADPGGVEFRFTHSAPPATPGLLGLNAGGSEIGFGCESPDALHVERRGENEIVLPGCADFPNPLVRCPAR
jgi:hypothetical protein